MNVDLSAAVYLLEQARSRLYAVQQSVASADLMPLARSLALQHDLQLQVRGALANIDEARSFVRRAADAGGK